MQSSSINMGLCGGVRVDPAADGVGGGEQVREERGGSCLAQSQQNITF